MVMQWSQLLNSKRPRPSTVGDDHRAQFERDFDRAVFSTPVKRLQDKAQVFPLEPHDAVRTRLTHSLEVSSVARGLAARNSKWLIDKGEINHDMGRSIEAIAATCGLIHDLGNPPFGHAGEFAIQHWFSQHITSGKLETMLNGDPQLVQDFLKFEGNAQSLRLIAKLQVLADYHGLNLTYGTLSASCKYIAASHEASSGAENHAMSKPGYFASENSLIRNIRTETGTGDARNPITFLVESSDDIVYSVADIEDGVKKGILSWAKLSEELLTDSDSAAEPALRRMKNILKAGRESVPLDLPDDVFAAAFRTAAIGVLVESVSDAFQKNYDSIMEGTFHGELVEECSLSPLITTLKSIGRRKVYCTPPTLKLEIMGRKIIQDLMTLFWEGAEHLPTSGLPKPKNFPGKIGALLSENYRKVFQHFATTTPELPEDYHRFQLVTDYVCGMTDSFAKRLHAEVFNGF